MSLNVLLPIPKSDYAAIASKVITITILISLTFLIMYGELKIGSHLVLTILVQMVDTQRYLRYFFMRKVQPP